MTANMATAPAETSDGEAGGRRGPKLREEFSERAAEVLASGTSVLDKEIAREEVEKKGYEESRFVRLVTSRKDKRQREHDANRADYVTDIDNFAGVQDIPAGDKGKRRIPTHIETAKRIGSKTGGIFSHVEAPPGLFVHLEVEKKRQPSSQLHEPSATALEHLLERLQPLETVWLPQLIKVEIHLALNYA